MGDGRDNLILWQPGQSGNPKGPKKGTRHFKTVLKEYLAKKTDVRGPDGEPLDSYDLLALDLLRQALYSEDETIRLRAKMDIADRIEGKSRPVERVDNKKAPPGQLAHDDWVKLMNDKGKIE